MFRPMRRIRQQLSDQRAKAVLENGKTGVLAVNGDDGYPYTVAVNYVYYNGKIYIHSAKEGHKIDAIKNNDKVSFCVIENDEVFIKKLTTLYRNTVVFGRAKIIENGKNGENKEELTDILTALGLKYNSDEKSVKREIKNALDVLCCIEITPEHITGKEAIELTSGH